MFKASKEKMEADKNSQTAAEAEEAKESRGERHDLLSSLSMLTGPQIIQAGKDRAYLNKLRDYNKRHRKPTKAEQSEYDAANKNFEKRRKMVTEAEPIRSSIGCLHFEDAELMNFSKNDSYVEVPLDTRLVAWRGQ